MRMCYYMYHACCLYVLIDYVLYIMQCAKQPVGTLRLQVPQSVLQIKYQLQAAQEHTILVGKGTGQ
jgi:hypothetical protein